MALRYNRRILFGIFQINLAAVCLSQKYTGDLCTDSKNRNGTCQPIISCPIAMDELNVGIIPTTCNFEGRIPIVCCSNVTVTSMDSSSTATSPTREPGDTAQYWCNKYMEVCPIRREIAGGIRVMPSEFPHMAAIGYGEENSIQWFCGGSLISDKFVLTAAHCLTSGRTGSPRWVLLGAESLINRTSSDLNRGQIHPVIRRIKHPDYKPPSKYNDVALLEIGPAVTPNPVPTTSLRLHPACLPSKQWTYRLTKAYATGWGRTGHAEDGSLELLKAELDIFALSKCNETFDVEIRTTNLLKKGIDETMICAGDLQGDRDTCQGDSGGPLQMSIRRNCMYEIWGITSFGKACAFANSPAAYMRIAAYVPWIESIVWP